MVIVGSIQELEDLSGYKVCIASPRPSAFFLHPGIFTSTCQSLDASWSMFHILVGFPVTKLLLKCQATDLHRHHIDLVTIPSKRGPEFGVLKRIDDVS